MGKKPGRPRVSAKPRAGAPAYSNWRGCSTVTYSTLTTVI
jgi:hypothetical protein